MNDLATIISLLNTSEQASFVLHLQKRNKRADTKNIQLFKAIIKGNTAAIESSMTVNAFHVLKKRLTDRVIDYTATCIIETEQTATVEIMKRLILSQKLLSLKHFKTGFKQLKKAELKAQSIGNYHLLNDIYQTYIQYSYHPLSPDQKEIFKDYEKNQRTYHNQAKLNMVYAMVRKAFSSPDPPNESLNLNDLIDSSFQQFGISEADGFTFQSLSQIAEICDISGSHHRNYFEIDLFFENQIEKLQDSQQDIENNHPDHLKLLYLVAHIYFRKKDFIKSMAYLNQLDIQMNRFKEKYRPLYDLNSQTLQALNLNFSGKHGLAAKILDAKIDAEQSIKFQASEMLQAILSRVVIHFQQGELKKTKEKLALLWHQDSWYLNTIGQEWLLNKKFIEILLEIELGNTDYADGLLKSILRKRDFYFRDSNALALPFLELVKAYHHNPTQATSKTFAEKVEATFNWKPAEEEDLFLMSYYAWLKSKMTGKPVYEITLGFLGEKTATN